MATFHPVTMNSLKPLTPSINAEANHKEEQFIKSTETILATGNKLLKKQVDSKDVIIKILYRHIDI